MDISEINLLDRDVFAQRVPHDWFSYLREHAPVYKHPETYGPGFWVLTRYDDIRKVNMDPATFSSDEDLGGVVALEDAEPETRSPPAEFNLDKGARNIIATDPPIHTRYRKLIMKGFTPRMINALEGRIRAYSIELLENVIAKGKADWVKEIAAELPIRMISELLGLPREDHDKIFDWSNRIVGSEDPEFAQEESVVARASAEMFAYAQAMMNDRLENPADDIVTALLAPDENGDRLTPFDFNLFFLILAIAGNETTRYSATQGIAAMIEHPDQYAQLVADPTLIPKAVDEIIRWTTPVMYFRRTATKDTEIGGVPIMKGDKVAMYYISANRDESVFTDPFRFDIHRSPNNHIAFGGGGPHYCIGAQLAKLQLRVLFEELVKRVPTIKAAGEAERLRSILVNGIKHLPVDLTSAHAAVPA